MLAFGDSTPVPWSSGLQWNGNDEYLFEEEDDGWQEVGLATDVAEHFQPHASQNAVPLLILGEGRESKISVAELLVVAVHTDQPELNFPDRRKRLAGKQCLKDDVGFMLGQLQRHPEAECWFPANAVQSKLGLHAYQRFYAAAVGKPIRQVNQEAALNWAQAAVHLKNSWAFIAVLHAQLYSKEPGKALVRVPVPEGAVLRPAVPLQQMAVDPVIGEGYGILLTYHTNLGLHDAGTKQLLAQNYTPHEIVRLMKDRPLYLEGFEEFNNKIQMLATGFGWPNHAASMEYCFNSKEKGRVHFHAFVGPDVRFWGWQLSLRRVSILRSHLLFDGLFPNVQVMKPRGRHGVSVCACHGMYYCLGPKLGQVFSHGTAKPFEDRCTRIQ